MNTIFSLLCAAMFALSLSLDTFAACFAYGSGKYRLPFFSGLIIDLVTSAVLGLSMFFGSLLQPWIPPSFSRAICFLLLFSMGSIHLLDEAAKAFLRRHDSFFRNISFSALNFRFVLSVYADPENADTDDSRSISPKKSAFARHSPVALTALLPGSEQRLAAPNLPQSFSLPLSLVQAQSLEAFSSAT